MWDVRAAVKRWTGQRAGKPSAAVQVVSVGIVVGTLFWVGVTRGGNRPLSDAPVIMPSTAQMMAMSDAEFDRLCAMPGHDWELMHRWRARMRQGPVASAHD